MGGSADGAEPGAEVELGLGGEVELGARFGGGAEAGAEAGAVEAMGGGGGLGSWPKTGTATRQRTVAEDLTYSPSTGDAPEVSRRSVAVSTS